jgi:hypothetical protein
MEEHRPKKLLDQVRDAIRLKHYSYRTEQAYVGWIKRYIYFHDVRHPSEMGAPEVEAFLTHLAVKEHVAASTQNQALSALLFLYREVLHQELGPVDALRAKRPKRLPTVLTKGETLRLIGCLSGTHQLMAKLIYGSGVRLMECLRLRIKDLEFERRALIVRDGKGAQDQLPVDGGSSMVEAPTMSDVGIHVVQGDGGRGFVRPGKEKLHVAGVMDVSGGVGIPAAQPLAETFDLWEHRNTSRWQDENILPPGGWLLGLCRLWDQSESHSWRIIPLIDNLHHHSQGSQSGSS